MYSIFEVFALAQIGVDPILDPDLWGIAARARDVLELHEVRRWIGLDELISKHLTFLFFDQFEF